MIRSTCSKEGKETGERIDRNGKLWGHHCKAQWLERAVFVQVTFPCCDKTPEQVHFKE